MFFILVITQAGRNGYNDYNLASAILHWSG